MVRQKLGRLLDLPARFGTDIEAARAAGVRVIGYANRSWKVNAFSAADAVVTSMGDLAEILAPRPK